MARRDQSDRVEGDRSLLERHTKTPEGLSRLLNEMSDSDNLRMAMWTVLTRCRVSRTFSDILFEVLFRVSGEESGNWERSGEQDYNGRIINIC